MWFFELLFERDLRARHLERKSDERRWQSPGHKSTKFLWSEAATYQWQLCFHFTCAMSRTDHQKFMIACCFVNGVVDPLAIVFDSIWFCWRVVVQYGWELQITIPHFILMPPLSHVYNHRQLLGHGDYDIHDGCCCWWWHDLQKITDIPQMCDIVWCSGDSSNGF